MPSLKFRVPQLRYFWHFINERHSIYEKRKRGEKWPWTKDKILKTYKFTNVFRQLDRVTKEWQDRFCRLLHKGKGMTDGDLLFHVVMFRLFNWPATYDKLYFGMRAGWNRKKAGELLAEMKAEKKQIFTGAYIVTSGGESRDKFEVILDALEFLHKRRNKYAKRIKERKSMRKAVKKLQRINTVGPFVAYEIACDLRFTRLLCDARDVLSWANPGPGAKRGIHRLLTGKADWKGKRPDYIALMYQLWQMRDKMAGDHVLKCEWPFEMREIEHSLCEYDKYMRVKNGEGKPRSIYRPPQPEQLKLPWED